jgi:hypothetical protein
MQELPGLGLDSIGESNKLRLEHRKIFIIAVVLLNHLLQEIAG